MHCFLVYLCWQINLIWFDLSLTSSWEKIQWRIPDRVWQTVPCIRTGSRESPGRPDIPSRCHGYTHSRFLRAKRRCLSMERGTQYSRPDSNWTWRGVVVRSRHRRCPWKCMRRGGAAETGKARSPTVDNRVRRWWWWWRWAKTTSSLR